VTSDSESHSRHCRPLYSEILFPDLSSYRFPPSLNLHSGIINKELNVLRHQRPGAFLRLYVLGVRRYPGLLRRPVPTPAGPRRWLDKYIMQLSVGRPARHTRPSARGLEVPHTLAAKTRQPQCQPEDDDGQNASHRR
jgi:hypothetical protein